MLRTDWTCIQALNSFFEQQQQDITLLCLSLTEENYHSLGGESIEIVDQEELSEMLKAACLDGGRDDIAKVTWFSFTRK